MTITLVSSTAFVFSGTDDVDVDIPSGYEANDILILVVAGNSFAADTPASISGWTLVAYIANTAGPSTRSSTHMFWKRATSSESTINVAHGGTALGGKMLAFRGCLLTGDPINAFTSSIDSSTAAAFSITGLTTTEDNCMIVFTKGGGKTNNIAGGFSATPGSPTVEWDDATLIGTDISNTGGIYLLATAGATGAITGNMVLADTDANIVLALLPALPVLPAVLSVEKFSISMPNATVSTPALSLGQDIDNCVPFITVESDDARNRAQTVDVKKNVGTDKFDFTSHADGARNLEVTIVEFDPAEVTIQEVSFTLGSAKTVNVTVSAIVEANTFPIIYGETGENSAIYSKILFRAAFTSTTVLRLDKETHAFDDFRGHAYILEALNGAWSIETGASISRAYGNTDATANSSITVDAGRTGVWSYWDNTEGANDPRDAIWDTVITDDTNLDLTRGAGSTPAATGDIETFVVEFAAAVAVVQQGEFNYGTAATKTAAISAPGTLDNAMVVGTNALGWCEGAGLSGKEYSLGRMSFNSATEVLGTRNTLDGNTFRQNFQVIEWLIAGAGGAGSKPLIIMLGF